MAYRGPLFVVLLVVATLGFGPQGGTVQTRHAPAAIGIGKAHGNGMAMSTPPNSPIPPYPQSPENRLRHHGSGLLARANGKAP